MCRNSNHNMKVRYGNCSNILCNEGGLCSFRTKSLKCLAKQSNIRFYECEYLNIDFLKKFKHLLNKENFNLRNVNGEFHNFFE